MCSNIYVWRRTNVCSTNELQVTRFRRFECIDNVYWSPKHPYIIKRRGTGGTTDTIAGIHTTYSPYHNSSKGMI